MFHQAMTNERTIGYEREVRGEILSIMHQSICYRDYVKIQRDMCVPSLKEFQLEKRGSRGASGSVGSVLGGTIRGEERWDQLGEHWCC